MLAHLARMHGDDHKALKEEEARRKLEIEQQNQVCDL